MKTSRLFTLAAAASLVMGISTSVWAVGSNTAKVTFTGNIVDSPCSLTIDTEDQTVNMGRSIGNGTLAGGRESTKHNFQIKMEDCTFTTEQNMNVVFTAGDGTTAASGVADNLAVMKTDGTGAISNVSLALGDINGANIKLGDTFVKPLDMDTATPAVGLANQQLDFTAWLVGAATGTVGTGEFSSSANVTISYL